MKKRNGTNFFLKKRIKKIKRRIKMSLKANLTQIDGKIRNKRVRIQSVTGKSSLQNLFDETISVSTKPSNKVKPQSY